MYSKLFHIPQICLFYGELLRWPNELKIDTDLTHLSIFQAKKKTLDFFELFMTGKQMSSGAK